MNPSQEATILSLRRHNAVILPFVDGNVARHTQWMRLRGLSERTIGGRKSALDLLTKHASKPVRDITPDDLHTWQITLGVLALNTRKSYVSHVREFYAWAADNGVVPANPTAVLIMPKVPPGLPRPIGERALEFALAQAPLRIRLWLELAAYDGLRAAEIAAIERPDVMENADPAGLFVHGKGRRERVVPLSATPLASLFELGMPRTGRLFRKLDGFPVSPHYVSQRTNRYLHRIGVPESLHQLRHRFGTQALGVSGNLREVQELMGHASPKTTAVYTFVNPQRSARTVAAIDHPLLRPVQDAS
jgi:site-specific recombinase XerD